MLDQSLRNPCVHTVHGHVVPVVGSPAEGQLGEVAGTDDQTVALVGYIHQDLRPFTCLCVLVCSIVVVRILTDILEVLHDSLADIHYLECAPQSLDHGHCICLGSLGGSETRHGHTDDPGPVQVEHVESPDSDQKCKRGVQATRDSDDGSAAVDMAQPLLEAQGLQGKDFLASGGTQLRIFGYERHPVYLSGEVGLPHLDIETDVAVLLVVGGHECVSVSSLMLQMLEINFRNQ